MSIVENKDYQFRKQHNSSISDQNKWQGFQSERLINDSIIQLYANMSAPCIMSDSITGLAHYMSQSQLSSSSLPHNRASRVILYRRRRNIPVRDAGYEPSACRTFGMIVIANSLYLSLRSGGRLCPHRKGNNSSHLHLPKEVLFDEVHRYKQR